MTVLTVCGMLEEMEQNLCQICHYPLEPKFYFCPNCGKRIKEPPPSTSLGKQLGLYLMSILLPPFGLIPAFRYLRQRDTKSHIIGIIAILLTTVSAIVSIWIAVGMFNKISDETYKQLNQYQQYGGM